MAKIIGNTTATPNPRPDWNQTDPAKADYIKNKPTILTEEDIVELIVENGSSGDGVVVEQVQSDWNQTDETKVDYIKNKPELATVAISGSYNDLIDLPSIEVVGSGVYVGTGTMPEGYNVQINPDGEIATIPTKISELKNDVGFITANQLPEGDGGVVVEVDPTVPPWAKQPNPPTYTAADVGALPADTVILTNDDVKVGIKSSVNFVTPEMYGAKGDGVACDTDAFINALKSGKKVVCDSKKTYYFSKPVDVRTLVRGHLDGGNAYFENFHIYININDDFNDWRDDYSPYRFTIENMVLGAKGWNELSEGWETPCITSGSPMIMRNIVTRSYPYVYAAAGLYIDVVEIEHWVSSINWANFEGKSIELDTISYLNKNGEYKRFDDSSLNSSQGDGWKISQCQEFHSSSNPEYRFMCIGTKMPVVMEECVQCSVKVFGYGHLVLVGCHYEGAKVECVSSGKITFINTYFYSTHTLLDNQNVVYQNCFFRCMGEPNNRTLAEVTGNKSWYDLKCTLINCTCPDGHIINSQELKTYKGLPKKTYNTRCIDNLSNSLSASNLVNEPTWWGNNVNFPELGAYTYDIYLFTTSLDDIALAHKQFTLTLDSSLNRHARWVSYNLCGGVGIVIVRQNPNGELYRAEYYINPSFCDDTNTDIKLAFRDHGGFSAFYLFPHNGTDYIQYGQPVGVPWIKIDSKPSITINNKLFEANGVLVTSDDSVVNLSKYVGQTQVSKNALDRITNAEFNTHTSNSSHITAAERTTWNAKADESYVSNAIKSVIDVIPDYVIEEAESVIDRVLAAQVEGNRTFTFAAISDMHYGNGNTEYPGGYTDGVKHACQAMKYIDERIKLDAVAVLGDYCDSYPAERFDDAIGDFKTINSVLADLRFAPNLRIQGNHDYYSKHTSLVNRFIQSYSDNVVWGSKLGGYFYRDFDEFKLRIICINTTEEDNANIDCSDAQYEWFAQSLDVSAKEKANEWQILILSHHPLDWYSNDATEKNSYWYQLPKIIYGYKQGFNSATATGYGSSFKPAFDFSQGNNSAQIVANIHGHIHNLLTAPIYLNIGNTDKGNVGVYRMATPEACIGRANQYNGIWKETNDANEEITYGKKPYTKEDTSFVVYCIDLDENTITAVCYGAGYDRKINYLGAPLTYRITNNLTNVKTDNETTVINENTVYNANLTATEGDIISVVVTMGEIDITDIAYSGGVIHIEAVKGDIVISAAAREETPETTYINQIPKSINADGSLYNGGVGYKSECRLTSSGIESTDEKAAGVSVTGFIPVSYGDTIYLKNVNYKPGVDSNADYLASYSADFTLVTSAKSPHFYANAYLFGKKTYDDGSQEICYEIDENGYLTSFRITDRNVDQSYIRMSAAGLNSDSVITINQPIE